jgi:fructose-1-phosphate kinase PfkB-like protein
MIKTTMEELPALIDREVKNEADVIAGAKELHEAGARYVIVTDHSRFGISDMQRRYVSCTADQR